MRRLVYNPRAFVYIKDQDGTIHDVSTYVTAGSITRRIDQVSSADINLRNPGMIFTAHYGAGGVVRPLFHPMDPITIYLERVKGKPVRVFTGFLDTTPYLQLYPGVIQLKASCTLKRLLYTYFDPALPYTQTFLQTYGWIPFGNGMAVSSTAYDEYLQQDKNDPKAAPRKKDQVDGSLANLLYATLKHIGHWHSNDVYVEALPPDIFTRIAALSQEFAKDNEDSTKKFIELLKSLAGSTGHGSADGNDPTISTFPPGSGTTVGASTFTPSESNQGFAGGGTKFPGGQIPTSAPPPPGLYYAELSTDYTQGTSGDFAALGKLPFATPLRITYNGKSVIARKADVGAGNPSHPKIDLWETTAKALGFPGSGNVKIERLTEDQVKQLKNDPAGLGGALPGALPDSTSRSPTKGGSSKSTSSNNSSATTGMAKGVVGAAVATGGGGEYGASRSYGSHAGVDISMAEGTPLIALCRGTIAAVSHTWYSSSNGKGQGLVTIKSGVQVGPFPPGTMFGYGHPDTIFVKVGDTVEAGERIALSGNPGGGPHLHFFVNTAGVAGGNGNTNPTAIAKALLDGTQLPTTGGGSADTGATGSNSDSGSAAQTGVGAAFFGNIEWAGMTDIIGSTLLGGEKSLLNDKPLMPFIQQLCNASLRHFQSLPDGRFYAFFPDYFGEMNHRKPYWEIDDIEILDGSISLTDDSLITHMYVIGDTLQTATGGSDFLTRALNSSGVVTVFNVFMADSVLNRDQARKDNKAKAVTEGRKTGDKKQTKNLDSAGMGLLLDRKEVVAFLDRYGARPFVEDMPFIRSPYYEMFLAYQKFLLAWSRQFATPFSFTFMPELFPGGKVGFPAHGLQMYIEEVVHSFDYESGFTSTATLSSPSEYKTAENTEAINLLPPNMVNAIIAPSLKNLP